MSLHQDSCFSRKKKVPSRTGGLVLSLSFIRHPMRRVELQGPQGTDTSAVFSHHSHCLDHSLPLSPSHRKISYMIFSTFLQIYKWNLVLGDRFHHTLNEFIVFRVSFSRTETLWFLELSSFYWCNRNIEIVSFFWLGYKQWSSIQRWQYKRSLCFQTAPLKTDFKFIFFAIFRCRVKDLKLAS